MGGKKGRAFGIVEGRRQRHELRCRDDRFIGVSAVTHLDDHPVADGNALCRAVDFDHVTGDSTPGVNGSSGLS